MYRVCLISIFLWKGAGIIILICIMINNPHMIIHFSSDE